MMVTMGMLVTDLSKGSQIKNRSSRPQTFHKNLSSRDTVMLVTKMTITVTNILYLSPTHFVSNIRHQHRCSLCQDRGTGLLTQGELQQQLNTSSLLKQLKSLGFQCLCSSYQNCESIRCGIA